MDQKEFNALVKEHDVYVRGVVMKMVRHTQDVDEVTSCVWWNVWRAIDRFDWAVRVETWISKIAVNAALDFLRRKQRRVRVEAPLEDCYSGEGEVVFISEVPLPDRLRVTSPEELVQGGELMREIDRALEALPVGLRQALLLRIEQGAAYADIQQELGVPIGTVMSRLHRARQSLAERLRKLEYELPEEQTSPESALPNSAK